MEWYGTPEVKSREIMLLLCQSPAPSGPVLIMVSCQRLTVHPWVSILHASLQHGESTPITFSPKFCATSSEYFLTQYLTIDYVFVLIATFNKALYTCVHTCVIQTQIIAHYFLLKISVLDTKIVLILRKRFYWMSFWYGNTVLQCVPPEGQPKIP